MDEVSIPLSLLEEVRDTLTSAAYFSQTLDLLDHYRAMKNTQLKQTKLTQSLSASSQILQSFIEAAQTDDEDNDGADSES